MEIAPPPPHDMEEARQAIAQLGRASQIRTYAPAWTSTGNAPSLENGTLEGWYWFDPRQCWASIKLTWGSTPTTGGTGTWRFSLPFTIATGGDWIGSGLATDTGTRSYPVTVLGSSGASFVTAFSTTAGTGTDGIVDVNTPFTWASGDILRLTLAYPKVVK